MNVVIRKHPEFGDYRFCRHGRFIIFGNADGGVTVVDSTRHRLKVERQCGGMQVWITPSKTPIERRKKK